MQSGKLRHRVTLLRRVDNQQPGGQVQHSYVPFAEVWGNVRPLSGRELIAAQQVNSLIDSEITIRYRVDVDETCRVQHIIKHDESPQWFDTYDVIAVIPDPKTNRRELRLACVKRTAEGWRG